jgi:hypothetical protein
MLSRVSAASDHARETSGSTGRDTSYLLSARPFGFLCPKTHTLSLSILMPLLLRLRFTMTTPKPQLESASNSRSSSSSASLGIGRQCYGPSKAETPLQENRSKKQRGRNKKWIGKSLRYNFRLSSLCLLLIVYKNNKSETPPLSQKSEKRDPEFQKPPKM